MFSYRIIIINSITILYVYVYCIGILLANAPIQVCRIEVNGHGIGDGGVLNKVIGILRTYSMAVDQFVVINSTSLGKNRLLFCLLQLSC